MHYCLFKLIIRTTVAGLSGEGVRRHTIKDIETGSQIKGKQQTQLFNNGENIIYPLSSTQAVFQFFNIVFLLLIG